MKRDRRWGYVALSLAVIAAFFTLREHWGHALGFFPYLVLLICPALHLFHGQGRHGRGGRDHRRPDGGGPRGSS
ncbi:MAG: DUF2933 domain-containing protein [Pseudomonadota bacterium]